LLPTLPPFNLHWYDGVAPPFVGVAVNVTLVPEHTELPGSALMLTEGVTLPEILTAKLLAVPLPQALEGVTVTLPELAPTVTVIELVVPPAV
jgi:hypothetical protein